ncbi:hypothetical protein B0H10DRAFT_1956545 [Mycena sp. CBHHK59/15]|nr:hypothetical protein B0H10DRAFT_1956545 [Mycena sp. CBHHK59/15]
MSAVCLPERRMSLGRIGEVRFLRSWDHTEYHVMYFPDCQKGEKNAFFRAAGHSVSGAPIDGARGQIVLGSPENSLVTARHLDARQDVGSGRYSPGLAVGTVSWPISTKQEYDRRQAFRYGGKTLVNHDREHTGAGLWHQD